MITVDDLDRITGARTHAARKAAFLSRLRGRAPDLLAPHVLAQLLAQVLHESGGFAHVEEVWGPTPAQRGYEGRSDLGNDRPGDGRRYLGRDLIQCTGRANYRALTLWCRDLLSTTLPDFEAEPELLSHPQNLGLAVIWYWKTRVPARHVDAGNIEMVTRAVNGGLNGLGDRLAWYDRSAMVLLGYWPDDIRQFQAAAGITVDGVSGPQTRAALHRALVMRSAQPAPASDTKGGQPIWAALLTLLRRLICPNT